MQQCVENENTYRVRGTSLYEYSPAADAYVHVYRNDRCTTKRQLIEAYRRCLELDEFS